MPKCGNSTCNRKQNKLGKSGLCKGCNAINSNDNNCSDKLDINLSNSSNSTKTSNIIDLTVQRDLEIITILKDQISFLKKELEHKNAVIDSLLGKIPSICEDRNTVSINRDMSNDDSLVTRSVTSSDDYLVTRSIASSYSNLSNNTISESYTEGGADDKNSDGDNVNNRCSNRPPCVPSSDLTWQPVGGSRNEHRITINDDHSDFEKTWENSHIQQAIIENNRSNQIADRRQSYNRQDNNEPNAYSGSLYKKTVPGNSTYAEVSNKGRKIGLISDSICGRIQMRDLSSKTKNGHVYRRYHPGATPKQLHDYCINTLTHDKPDEIIIHVGTNSLRSDDACTIANDIVSIVNTCRLYGVNTVYVSAITFRPGLGLEVKQVNDILFHKSQLLDFNFIGNSNISSSLIYKDKVHLTDDGSAVLKNNFIRAINTHHR